MKPKVSRHNLDYLWFGGQQGTGFRASEPVAGRSLGDPQLALEYARPFSNQVE